MRLAVWVGCFVLLVACSDDVDEPVTDGGTEVDLRCAVRGDRDEDGVDRLDRSQCQHLSADERTFPLDATEDCDDDDPDVWYGVQFYTDDDGDGFGAPLMRSVWGCAEDTIEGFAPNARDCDDDDSLRGEVRFPDQDGDGFGAGKARCVESDAPGFSESTSDCDDGASAVNPSAPGERTLDGVDTNCDGTDYPWFSAPEADGGMASWPDPLTIPEAVRCEGRGLSILALEVLEDCGGGFRLQVGNRGDQPVTGRLRVAPRVSQGGAGGDSGSGAITPIELPEIAAGEVVRTEWLGPGNFDVELVFDADAGSCQPQSASGRAWGPFVNCR